MVEYTSYNIKEMRYYKLANINTDYLKGQEYFLLFETGLCNKDNFTSYIFTEPVDIIKINRYHDVEKAFGKIQDYSRKYYLAGYFSYELGYFFEKDLFKAKDKFWRPLIYLCVFDKAVTFNHKTGRLHPDIPGIFARPQKNEDFEIKNLKLNFSLPEYLNKIKRIKECIRRGDTYQVNFTAKLHFDFWGSAFSFCEDLKNRQNVSYSAFCKFKDEYVISLSPELFFKRDGLKIYSKPMKGTVKRGKDIQEDLGKAASLKNSMKNRAENLMIVDLIRNDLGRISKVNSVKVSRLFEVEKYNTLFQMTSTVESTLRKNITYFEIFKSIFPGGSVTGAPKLRTMQIIKELENAPRGVYCGALGIISPQSKAIFNLPIRTVSLLRDKGEMGVGGGIVIDSNAAGEFKECLLKAKFLTDRYQPFRLLETILWNAKFKFLNEHLKRMGNSAKYFDFCFKAQEIRRKLKDDIEKQFAPELRYKVRLLLDKEGNIEVNYARITEDSKSQDKYIAVSRCRIDPENIFCYHKTTHRPLYDKEYNFYRRKGYFEVIFLNKQGKITEGAISNIIIKRNKRYYTPPVSSGILPGIFRQYFMHQHRVKEKMLTLGDLKNADKIFLCNSVRGLTEVRL